MKKYCWAVCRNGKTGIEFATCGINYEWVTDLFDILLFETKEDAHYSCVVRNKLCPEEHCFPSRIICERTYESTEQSNNHNASKE